MKEENSEGVNFYELDDREEFVPTGNEPIPHVMMPSFKKRVHSQRISHRERPTVTPYESPYDETYSSDEENKNYEVYEPEDLTERSNSTVTFSEDIYDSDAFDEMIRSQIRKTSEISQEGFVRSEDLQDGGKPTRSILKDGKGRGSKKDGVTPRLADLQLSSEQSKITQIIVSPPEMLPESELAEGGGEIPEAAPSTVNKKDGKGEELVEDVTKPLQDITIDTVTDKATFVKGERKLVTKSPQSTIPLQIDQITDSPATNKHDFAKSDEKLFKNETKPPKDTAFKSSETPFQETALTDNGNAKIAKIEEPIGIQKTSDVFLEEETKTGKTETSTPELGCPVKTEMVTQNFRDLTLRRVEKESHDAAIANFTESIKPRYEILISSSEEKSPPESTVKQTPSPSKEEAAETAVKLIEDITKAVHDVFPDKSYTPGNWLKDAVTGETSEIKAQNCGTKDLESTTVADTGQLPKPSVDPSLPEARNVLGVFAGLPKSELGGLCTRVDTKPEKEEMIAEAELESGKAQMDMRKHIPIEEMMKVSGAITVLEKETVQTKKIEIPQPCAESTEKIEKLSGTPSDLSMLVGTEKIYSSTALDKGVNKMAKIIPSGKEISGKSLPSAGMGTIPTEKSAKTGQEKMNAKEKSENVRLEAKLRRADILVVESSDNLEHSERETTTSGSVLSDTDQGLGISMEDAEVSSKKSISSGTTEQALSAAHDVKPDSETKPRVIFRIDSEDDLHSDADNELVLPSYPSTPTEDPIEKSRRELKEILERDQIKIEERMTSMKGRIFDISGESLLKTKELVDERLRKISEIKPPQDFEEAGKKEKSPGRGEEPIKIGRFHITPALVEEAICGGKESEIAERLKTTRADEEMHDEVEKELPEKLTEADLEEVIRELKKEGLKTDVYLQPEEAEKEEKREKTLKRVERRFERMASETLEMEKEEEEGVSEEKLNEKRELEFQRMISNLSNEEVAEYQQEYMQLWDEGGLSSLTPTDDWESRDPDTPENELDDDSPRKSESFRGSHGTGDSGEPSKSSEPKKGVKSPMSPPKSVRLPLELSPRGQPLTPIDPSHVGSSPSEIDQSSGFVSERSDDIPTYGDRIKFWEQMSHSSEMASELPRSTVESVSSVESVEIYKPPARTVEEHEKISVKAAKQKFEKEESDVAKVPEEGGLVKSLTESYSKKIAAGELIMPAIPRPKSSSSKDSLLYEAEQSEIHKLPDSSDTAVVSELEVKFRSRGPSAPITEHAVVPGSTNAEKEEKDEVEPPERKKMGRDMSSDTSTDSEAEYILKYGSESVAYDNSTFSDETFTLPLSERRKVFEESCSTRPPPVVQTRKSVHERSMSLPTAELPIAVKARKKYFEEEMMKEIIVEQVMSQAEEQVQAEKKNIIEEVMGPETDEVAPSAPTEQSVNVALEISCINDLSTLIISDSLKETHEEKSEIEANEKEKPVEGKKEKEEEFIPSITITTAGKRYPETGSIGESEDTQSESDVTPEEGRVVDNGDAQWDVTQSGDFSPKDDIDYPKEVMETGIGRWIGQEDLSQPSWEKDDLNSCHFKIQTKWERTRSEGGSPKDHYVCTPEEHYPDTVWEVPVQEQLEKEEVTHDIPIEKQVIIEKDEEEYEEEEMPKIKLTEEEAKEIAEEILEYIQFEVENRSSFLINDEETPEGITQAQVTDYLRHLTGGKEFDEQDVQLIESILSNKQKVQFWKSQSTDRATCSVDITDEELRSTGLENDSPMESQMIKLQSFEEENYVRVVEERDCGNLKRAGDAQRLKDVEIVDQTLAEVKESLEAAQEQLIEQHKKKMKSEVLKKKSPSEFEFKGMDNDGKTTEAITEQTPDWERSDEYETTTEIKRTEREGWVSDTERKDFETVKEIAGDEKKEATTEEFLKYEISVAKPHEEELTLSGPENEKVRKILPIDSSDESKKSFESQQTQTKTEKPREVISGRKSVEKTDSDKATKTIEECIEKVETEGKIKETADKEVHQQKKNEMIQIQDNMVQRGDGKIPTSSLEEKKESRDSSRESEKSEIKTIEKRTTGIISKISSTKTEILITDSKSVSEEFKNLEISVPDGFEVRKFGQQLYSSEDSPRSTSLEDSMKSPPGGEELPSSASSGDRQGESRAEKPDVVLRHSTTATLLKTDRRSGADLEPYSSSGESHYQSFEQTSSRPCSSDVEGLLAGNITTTGSSEYESAVSHEISSKQPTLTEYQTAVSSLSSRESIKSLDSESSGHLASVEVSSEASETLIPSALELDRDLEAPGVLEDDCLELDRGRSAGQPPVYMSQLSAPAEVSRPVDEDFEIISESEVASWTGGVSEEEDGVVPTGEDAISREENALKMKRSHEMTFQPEPKPIVFSQSLDGLSKDGVSQSLPSGLNTDENSSLIGAPDERFGSSLEETGSVLSMSLSTTSEPSAVRTVIELSHTDSEKMDCSLTVSGTSIDSASREDLDTIYPQGVTNEMSTSTVTSGLNKKTESVTMTTSSSDVHGVPCVSTQVTSISRKSSMVDEAKSESESHDAKPVDLSHTNGPTQVEYVADYDEVETTKTKKPQGHRRKESTSSFVPTMMWNLSEARTQKIRSDITESEEDYGNTKYVYDITLTEKEVKNDEKKEADDSESFEQGLDVHERKVSDGEEVEEFKDYDNNRPQSQISRTDSDSGRRPVSSVFSEDQPDSELSDLMKQGSSETEREDPLDRPQTPEPEDMENKDITPEFSSEAQASVTELEMEYSGAFSRRDEYASHVSPIREEKSDARFKQASEEYPEVEAVPDGLHSQTSLESTVAEKHELETGEKEILQSKLEEQSTNDIPDITVTEHVTPVSHQKFQYPEPREETKERKTTPKTPDTPASSRTSSSSTDQGREYNLDDVEIKRIPKEVLTEEKEVCETKDEKESLDSPSSDSFEMLDKPDITDEFVIIEEVGREAQENDQEGKSIKITSGRKKPVKREKEEQDVKISPPSPATKMTDLKYFPNEEDTDLFSFDSDSPPQPTTRKFVDKLKRRPSKEEKEDLEYEQQIEQNKKWLETQFQGEPAAKIMGAFGYEMEFERAPLEDIKEEELNELDSSSKIGSMGSQKESLGSFGSVKDSFSSTPDYDVLAGRKYFTKSGDHDDVSMSSLQEFELIEKKLMENGKKSGSSSSQDSLSSKKLGTSSKSGQGDDVSSGSLKEFETLENACATVVNMEKKAKQEEAILSEIDEGHESQISESESCETVSAVMKEKLELETEEFDKRMFEIDEIIRQAQSNVEKFSEMQAIEKIETIGRGDSFEEVAKVPDLELDLPLPGKALPESSRFGRSYIPPFSTQAVTRRKVEEWREAEQQKTGMTDKSITQEQPELLQNGGKIKSISADSLEIQDKEGVVEENEETISLDSYRSKSQKTNGYGFPEMARKSDSMEEVSKHHESSSSDHTYRPPPRADFMLGSTDSLDPSSSTATHATYQYETDSVMSSSFTSGDSNTMVSSTDNLDLLVSGNSVIDLSHDFAISRTDDWLENLEVGGVNPLEKKLIDQKKAERSPFRGLTGKTDEAVDADRYGRKFPTSTGDPKNQTAIEQVTSEKQVNKHNPEVIDVGPQVQKLIFKGPNADKALEEYTATLNPKDDVMEVKEFDEHGNIHVKKVLRQRIVVRRPSQAMTEDELQQYLAHIAESEYREGCSQVVEKKIEVPTEIHKITFKGPDAEKQLEEFFQHQDQEQQVEDIEEVDEHGNVHIKRIMRQRVVVRPDGKLTKEQLEQYFRELQEAETGSTSDAVAMQTGIKRITFKGPDAEKQFGEFMQQQQQEPEVEEIEEVDEHGNVYNKLVLRQRVVFRPDSGLTKEQLEQYLKRMQEPEFAESGVAIPPEIHKVTFKGRDAEKQLQEFIRQQQEPEVEEMEEVDEHGNVHIKRILQQRIVVKPDTKLTKDQMEKYLRQQQSVGETPTEVIHSRIEMPPEIRKITFSGPNAEKQFQEFMEQKEPEIEETEEVDEHGNVHVKRIIKQRVVVRPEQTAAEGGSQKSSSLLTEEELQKYLDNPEEPEYYPGDETSLGQEPEGKALVQKVVLKPQDLSDRLLTEEEFQERLKQQESGQTTVHAESIYIGGTEPFVSEIIEPLDEEGFSHIIHKKMQTAPEVQKVIFRGPNAEEALKAYLEALDPGEDFEEVEEVDSDGNVHLKRVLRRKIVLKPEDLEKTGLTGEELRSYLQKFEFEYFEGGEGPRVQPPDPNTPINQLLTEGFSSSVVLTEKEGRFEEKRAELESSSAARKECGISQRPPLVSDVSMDDEAEYDPTEHDWRHQLEILHAEADEEEIDENLDAALAGSHAPQRKN